MRQKNELVPCSASRRIGSACLSYDVGGNFGTRNRVFVEFGLVLWAARQARPAGQIHGDALGSLPQRLPGPRSRHRGRTRAATRTASFSRCARPTSAMSARAACRSSPLARAPALITGSYDIPAATLRARCRLHQHHADPGLSQLRPAGGDLRDRAAGRQGRRTSSASTASRCGARISSGPRQMPYRNAVGMLYDSGALRDQHGPGDGDRRLERLSRRGAREAKRRGKLLGLRPRQLRRILDRRAEGAGARSRSCPTGASMW